jgi:ATP-dependent exoDNAse (exonuclease V) beta subunit
MPVGEALLRADRAARESALDPRRSILLQAPAGSGKTAVLTQRFLRLLPTVDDPGEILAITFTRKAAAEMRGRIVRALRGETDVRDPGSGELRALAAAALRYGESRGWDLVRDAAALRIQTIDSFNYRLASELPVSSRVGGALSVTETPGELYRRAARRTLTAADDEPALASDAEVLLERLDGRWSSLERLLAQMLEQRGHWLGYVLTRQPEILCAHVDESLAHIIGQCLERAQGLLPGGLQGRLESLPGVGPLGSGPEQLGAWRALAAYTLTKDRTGWRRSLAERHLGSGYADAAARAALKSRIEELSAVPDAAQSLRSLAALPGPRLSHTEREALAALSRLLRRAALELQTEFASAGRVDYTYITGAARHALGESAEPTELALRTGLALRHILVDEFQDTSLAQGELLGTLTAGWEEGDGRTLFVVGDPMQSIYRFRDAEVGLFLAVREAGLGAVRLESLRLGCNFRASRALVDWTNEAFGQIFPVADELRSGAIAFSPSTAPGGGPAPAASANGAAAPSTGEAVELRLFPGDSAAEASAVAERIAALQAADPAATVAVLVAAHAHATPIVGALCALHIEVRGVDLVPLAERPVVRDLVQLARALYDLADRTAWLAVLRAPWCGARLATLTALSAAKDPQLPWEALNDEERLARCAAAERARLVRVRGVLAGALERRGREPPADSLERAWLELGGFDAYPPQDLEDARALFDALASSAAASEWHEPRDFERLIETLFSAPAASGANPVQIMTIHRAKGLEFDHVLVPALERPARGEARTLLRWIDLPRERGGSDLLLAPAPVIGQEADDRLGSLIGTLLATRAAHERARLMYVAVTRARRTLYLSGAPLPRKDGTLRPEPRSLLECLWPALAGRFVVEGAAPSLEALPRGTPPAPSQPLRRLRESWSAPELPQRRPLPHLPLGEATLEPPEFSWVGQTQRHIGTVVHALLATLADEGERPAREALERRREEVLHRLRQEGVPEEERQEAGRVVLRALALTLDDERGRWILARHPEAHSELALTGTAGGTLRSLVIDRSFVDEAGTRWVIDYKTSRHEGGDLEGFLAEEMRRYERQLAAYRTLAAALGPQPVRAALYFPLLQVFRELEPAAAD